MNALKKLSTSFLALWVAFGSVCSVTGIEAAFAAADAGHGHHAEQIDHTGGHDHGHHEGSVQDHDGQGHGEHANCCEDENGFEGITTNYSQSFTASSVVPQPSYALHFQNADDLLNLLPLEQIKFSVRANDPPDRSGRNEAERDASTLLL